MRSHPEVNNKKLNEFTPCELHQIEMMSGHLKITKSEHTFNHEAVYRIEGEVGLWTFSELKKRLLN